MDVPAPASIRRIRHCAGRRPSVLRRVRLADPPGASAPRQSDRSGGGEPSLHRVSAFRAAIQAAGAPPPAGPASCRSDGASGAGSCRWRHGVRGGGDGNSVPIDRLPGSRLSDDACRLGDQGGAETPPDRRELRLVAGRPTRQGRIRLRGADDAPRLAVPAATDSLDSDDHGTFRAARQGPAGDSVFGEIHADPVRAACVWSRAAFCLRPAVLRQRLQGLLDPFSRRPRGRSTGLPGGSMRCSGSSCSWSHTWRFWQS